MFCKNKDRIPLDVSVFELGYYWVKHDGMWFIAEFWPKEQEFFRTGQPYGFRANEFEEIELEKIQQPAHLINYSRKQQPD